AWSNITSGMPDSGMAWISLSTRSALRARSSSATPATAGAATTNASRITAMRGAMDMEDSGNVGCKRGDTGEAHGEVRMEPDGAPAHGLIDPLPALKFALEWASG